MEKVSNVYLLYNQASDLRIASLAEDAFPINVHPAYDTYISCDEASHFTSYCFLLPEYTLPIIVADIISSHSLLVTDLFLQSKYLSKQSKNSRYNLSVYSRASIPAK